MKAAVPKITKVFGLLATVGAALFAVAGAGAGTTGGPAGLDPWAVGLIQQQNDVLDPWAVNLVAQSRRQAAPVDSRDYTVDPWAVGLVAQSYRQPAPADSRDFAQPGALDPWAVGVMRQRDDALDPWAVGLVQRSPQAVPVDSRDVLPASRGAELTVIATTPSASPGFDYTDAGIGAAAALIAVMLVGVPKVMLRRHGSTQPAAR